MGRRKGSTNVTPEQERTFLQLVSFGMFPSQAARKVGLTQQAISARRKRDKAFAAKVEESEATAEFNLMAHVLKGAPKDWRAAMSLLERRFRSRWAKLDTNLRVGSTSSAAAGAAAASAQTDKLWRDALATVPGFAPGVVATPAGPATAAAAPPAGPPPVAPTANAAPEDDPGRSDGQPPPEPPADPIAGEPT
jgi:hypothetical protein